MNTQTKSTDGDVTLIVKVKASLAQDVRYAAECDPVLRVLPEGRRFAAFARLALEDRAWLVGKGFASAEAALQEEARKVIANTSGPCPAVPPSERRS
jgi:hypothetical protein